MNNIVKNLLIVCLLLGSITIPAQAEFNDEESKRYSSHKLFVESDNSLWGIGTNYYGELGTGENSERYDKPVKIMNNVKEAKMGYRHSIILKTDGSVWTFGSNEYGVLGCGTEIKKSNVPIKIMDNIKEIFAGETSSFALDENNILYRWGTNYGNGVGLKESEIQSTPFKYVENAKSLNSHWGFNLVLKQDDTLWIYGESEENEKSYTCTPTGITLSDLPIKILDDVNSIEETVLQNDHKCKILKNNGELFEFDLIEGKEKHSPEYKTEKIAEGVELPKVQITKILSFDDIVYKTDEMQKSIISLAKAGIISGTSDTQFSPDKPITRAEISALLLRMTAKDDENGNGDFSDVTSDKWYYNIAGASKKYGIISGFEDNTFRGDETITKVQMISLVSRALQNEKNIELSGNVNSSSNIPDWAKEDIAIAEKANIISDDTDLFNLEGHMTRGEAAVILYRLYNKI